jgi:hypothetical protein
VLPVSTHVFASLSGAKENQIGGSSDGSSPLGMLFCLILLVKRLLAHAAAAAVAAGVTLALM